MTQEDLAQAAGVSTRTVSDLEREIYPTARKGTATRLASALDLTGPTGSAFVAVARGSAPAEAFRVAEVAAKRTLPHDVASFIGREDELRRLVGAEENDAGSSGVIGICAIGGMAGIGKTTLAVHAAHMLAEKFPDGQFFLQLHGHTPGLQPVKPADALASLLQMTGTPPAQIPPDQDARIGLWRDHLADRRLLLVLDDAVGSYQIRPLLPGATGNLVIVTSRRRLIALEDAQAISLESLSSPEAALLFTTLADRPGLNPGDAAVGQIVGLCGHLPLAIGLLARQLHHHPAWTTDSLAAELSAAHDRLEWMVTEDRSVAAAFNLSYDELAPTQQGLFRRLALHPGTELDVYAAAALAGTGLPDARRHLTALYDQYLLTEPASHRYRMHDLIRDHARALADRNDSMADRDLATRRLLDYFQHAAEMADRYLTRYTRPGPLTVVDAALTGSPDAEAPAFTGVRPRITVPELSGAGRALSWARVERSNLLACLDIVTRAGLPAQVIALTAALASLLRHDGPWTEAIGLHTMAVQAARRLGDRLAEANAQNDQAILRYLTGDSQGAADAAATALAIYRDLGDRQGQANALNHLGNVWVGRGDYRDAADGLGEALAIYRDLGDRQGQANTLTLLGSTCYLTARYRDATDALGEALAIYRDLGDRQGQANALNNVGNVHRLTGDYPGAADALEQALAIYRDLGDREGQANILNLVGIVRRLTGDYPGAADALEQALAIYRDLGDRQGEANAFNFLGAVHRLTGNFQEAGDALRQALAIYRDFGDPGGEVEALNQVGNLQRELGDLDRAVGTHQQALSLAREISSSWDEAHALAGLGRCALATGHRAEALEWLRQAHRVFQGIGASEASDIAAEVQAIAAGAPSPP